jgi:hypothetical protein
MKMKKIAGLLFLVAVLLTGCLLYVPQGGYDSSGTPPPEERPDDQWRYDQQDVSDFYAYLGPQGLWVSYSPYGYVWMPRGIDYHWRPYTRGHWVFTDYGWTWMSGERWGWLVYHYGRWGWDRRLGWFWVPGTVWGPSWVAWRWGDAYIGWAPMPPGDDFDPRFGYRRHDFAIPGHYWNFIRGQEFMGRDLDRWVLPPERNVTIINYTRLNINIHVRENHVINDGVSVDHVRGLTNQIVERRQLKDARRPEEAKVEAKDVVVYRPEIRRSETARPKEVLEKDQAAARMDQEPQARGRLVPRASQAEEASIRRVQDEEKKRLEQDQRTEVDAIRRKAESEKISARNPADKQKIDASAKTRIAEAQKQQESEKAQMAARHKEESEKVKKVQVKKKETEEKH